MTRLLAFGDLQLGKRATHERAPGDGLADQRDALGQIAALAIANEVDAVINAGDTFEGPSLQAAEVVAYAEFVAELRANDIDVYTILGNGRHDLARRDTHALQVVDHLPGVYAFDRPAARFAGTSVDTALCFLPWVPAARLVAAMDGGDRDEINANLAQLLLRAAADLLDTPEARASLHRVLVLHGSIEGAGLPTGIPVEAHSSDVIPVDELAALGFDAVVAAHIHVPQAFDREFGWTRAIDGIHAPNPIMLYTGSPLPMDFSEGLYQHGVWLLDLNAQQHMARFVALDGRRLIEIHADLTSEPDQLGLDETDAVAAAIATHLPIDDEIVRVRIRGTEQQTGRVDAAAIKTLLADTHKAYIAFDTIRGQRARVDEIDEDIAPLDAVDLYARAHDLDDQVAAALRDDTATYLERVGAAS